MLFLIIFYLLMLTLDVYVFQALKTATQDMYYAKNLRIGYWIISFGVLAFIAYAQYLLRDRNGFGTSIFTWMLIVFLLSVIPKLVTASFILLEDITRIVRASVALFQETASDRTWPSRRRFVSTAAIATAAIPFSGILYGVAKGRYRYTVHRHTVTFPDLPDAFDGFTITQLSDFHIGSFDNKEAVKKGIDLVNAQESDMLLFTGDLVNFRAAEVDGWEDIFGALQASYGKYSVLGNHDYYENYREEGTLNRVEEKHCDIGFHLLKDEHISIEKEGQKIQVIGVENWGRGPFPKHGDLEKAVSGIQSNDFKILLSHDPSHWDEKVLPHPFHFHLTLSGHTHGFQLGIETPFFRFSPSQFRYPRWAGLYKEKEQYLYVNRGFGYLAFPGRVGIWPEITVLELKKS